MQCLTDQKNMEFQKVFILRGISLFYTVTAIILHVHFEYFTHTFSKKPIVLKHVHHFEAFPLGFRYKRFNKLDNIEVYYIADSCIVNMDILPFKFLKIKICFRMLKLMISRLLTHWFSKKNPLFSEICIIITHCLNL